MDELQPQPVAEQILTCKCCFEKISPADQFCKNCGFPLQGTDSEQQIFMYRRSFKKAELNTLGKTIKSASTTLHILAAIFFLYSLVYFFLNRTADSSSSVLITYAIVAIIFFLLGVWAEKKPVASLVSGLVLYILLLLKALFENPGSLINGAIFKIIIISYLIKGLASALDAEKIKKQHNI